MKPFKLEIEINNVVFTKTFDYDFSFIDFVKKLWDETPNNVKPETVEQCKIYIRKFTAYKLADFEKEHEVFNQMSRALNSGMDIKKYINNHLYDHRTLQQKFTSLCLGWVETVGASNYGFDGRNQHSHEQCEKIVKFMRENDIYSNMPLI